MLNGATLKCKVLSAESMATANFCGATFVGFSIVFSSVPRSAAKRIISASLACPPFSKSVPSVPAQIYYLGIQGVCFFI